MPNVAVTLAVLQALFSSLAKAGGEDSAGLLGEGRVVARFHVLPDLCMACVAQAKNNPPGEIGGRLSVRLSCRDFTYVCLPMRQRSMLKPHTCKSAPV
eukprot:4703875-Prymnesium_polylepis.1